MRLTRRVAQLLAIGIAVGAIALAIDALNWRARVVYAKLTGNLPEIPYRELVTWLVPNSAVYLEPLAESPNVVFIRF